MEKGQEVIQTRWWGGSDELHLPFYSSTKWWIRKPASTSTSHQLDLMLTILCLNYISLYQDITITNSSCCSIASQKSHNHSQHRVSTSPVRDKSLTDKQTQEKGCKECSKGTAQYLNIHSWILWVSNAEFICVTSVPTSALLFLPAAPSRLHNAKVNKNFYHLSLKLLLVLNQSKICILMALNHT